MHTGESGLLSIKHTIVFMGFCAEMMKGKFIGKFPPHPLLALYSTMVFDTKVLQAMDAEPSY